MNDLNDSQKELAETTEGMIVADAGPGTGKTKTIVDRYVKIVSRGDVAMNDVLMLTFTKNAAKEMEERIKSKISGSDNERLKRDSNQILAKTFDSFCSQIVMDAPEAVSEFFGIEEKLTRSARLIENQTVATRDFTQFLDAFLQDRGADYGDIAAIASSEPKDLLLLLNRLMSRGAIPLRKGWFGLDPDRDLLGAVKDVEEELLNIDAGAARVSPFIGILRKINEEGADFDVDRKRLSESEIRQAANGRRAQLFSFVHDLFYAYIRHMVSSNKLTFGLTAMFAFTVLYENDDIRKRNMFRYVMIDEFQDTNASQLMMSLLILKEPNLCVVGDWKQGIYGFRFVSIDNIVHFEKKVVDFRRFLNDDRTRIAFSIPEVEELSLDVNYRSSQAIIDESFRCLMVRATQDENPAPGGEVVHLTQGRDDIGDDTGIRYCLAESVDDEAEMVTRAIKDYVAGDYVLHEGEARPVGFGDIAVLTRNVADCRRILDACISEGIPAYLFGDMPIMATREGKLALAWLRLVNNEQDPWGYVPILNDMGYSLVDIEAMKQSDDGKTRFVAPPEIQRLRRELRNKRRRISELLSRIFSIYNLDNDITQAIISTISSAHRGSLMTIADVIDMIEDDIRSDNVYSVDNPIAGGAVKIMTMHKSKGLEFPVVIIPYLDASKMPSTQGDKSIFRFDENIGVRCTKTVLNVEGYSKIITDVDTAIARKASTKDYDEERRLFFVAVSRAKQYITYIAGNPSYFMKDISKEEYEEIPDRELPAGTVEKTLAEPPVISGYAKRPKKLGVHDIMSFSSEDGTGGIAEKDEVCGKGAEYGTKVHDLAYNLLKRKTLSDAEYEAYPELLKAKEVIDSLRDADLIMGEIDCGLPVSDPDAVLRGRIDLIAIYPDRVEIHDYKTDASDRYEPEYRIQLSVYAHAATGFYGIPAKCYIDYLGLGKTVEFDPLPIESIRQRVRQATLGRERPLLYCARMWVHARIERCGGRGAQEAR